MKEMRLIFHIIATIALALLLPLDVFSQEVVTENPVVDSYANECKILKVILKEDETEVWLDVPESEAYKRDKTFKKKTGLFIFDGWAIMIDYPLGSKQNTIYIPILGIIDRPYYDWISEPCIVKLRFGRIPYGADIVDLGYVQRLKNPINCVRLWSNIHIQNPYPEVEDTRIDEARAIQMVDSINDGITGIYESFEPNELGKYRLACIKNGEEYKIVYLGGMADIWKPGELKGVLRKTGTPGLYQADWYMMMKRKASLFATIQQGLIDLKHDGVVDRFIKLYPVSTGMPGGYSKWTGTGFALNNGYIVTNYHVVEDAKNISVQSINGLAGSQYSATVVATDKVNDLALLKIEDRTFAGYRQIPYSVKTEIAEIGENIFVLGYPLTSTMGTDIKLTTGIISSKTGFMGDVTLYQISAPIQPGNSGGPLFDNQGNLIGIVSAKHKGAENVGYAIKTSYLNNLVESVATKAILPKTNSVSSKSLTEKVKSIEKFVFLIECSK